MNKKLPLLLLSLLLAACAHNAPPQAGAANNGASAGADTEDAAQVLPRMELTDQLLYQFLLADIAAQRGQPDLAAQLYLELARSTRDPRVARRAAQLAYETHQPRRALEAFKLWQEIEPNSQLAKQMLSTLLLGGGRLDEAQPQIAGILEQDPVNAGRMLMQLYPLFARHADHAASYRSVHELAQPYLHQAETQWVLAQSAEAAGDHAAALAAAHQARTLRPEWDMAVLLEAQLQQREAPLQTLATLQQYLSTYPDANEVRLFYARALLEQKRYGDARTEFQRLQQQNPGNPELAFATALLSLQMGELDRAEQELKQSLLAGKKDSGTVYYYLGQLNEAKKDDAAALQQYRQVTEGEYLYASHLRIVYVLNKQGKLREARDVLHQTTARNNQQRSQLILVEAQLLRDAKQYGNAASVLDKGLEKLPNDTDLLYEAAMVADKQNKHEHFETLIRKLIKVDPNHAHAYNALGYSFLERNVRVQEGMQLVEKAYQLTPDDAAIIDSMGWGYYRLGDLDKSQEFLQRAYAAFPDPEVAAHLGEVLWQSGKHDDAEKVWRASLKDNPGHPALQAVMKRFMH
ncbi:MAG TPA: tetratricopeptide repeat protein [Gallionellaceae bacterium]|nr:tetratricopeptide repeat protein [Gallionellaceae bacterium]